MNRRWVLLIGMLLAGGCQTAGRQEQNGSNRRMKMGPPPPGYIRITGEPVPGWKPADMVAGPRTGPSGLNWTPLGPRPILDEGWSGNDDASGRVVSIAPHPTDPNTVYIASASGGIWKTTDAGLNWAPLTDELSILNHGCVTIDPSNPETVYAGTGEYTTQSNGDGLFRSTDGGAMWERIGTVAQVGSRCSRVVVDPTDPLVIHITGNSGYSRTDDGGGNWTRYLTGGCSDVALKPGDPSTVFVGRHGDGIYRSTNGGDSFTKLTTGLPGSNVNRILLAVAPSNPNMVYTAIINGSAGLRGFYKSTNGGDAWTEMTNTPNFPYPQGWYDAFVGVDPTNENVVYAGGVFPSYAVAGVIKSTTGGASWSDITYGAGGSSQLHPDQHAIAFGPTGTIWIGNDGGAWKSNNQGFSWINCNATLAVTQNYNIAVHPSDPSKVMGGTQDNGTVGRDLPIDAWPQIVAGDGGFLAYDFNEPERRYTTYVRLVTFRITDTSFADITGPWETAGDPVNFIAPLVMDPNDSHTLLGGTNRVWRTKNADTAADWTAISSTSVAAGGTLNTLAVALGAPDTIYSGSSNGRVFVTTNGTTWLDRSVGLPSGGISDIVIDPADPGTAYVAYYNSSGARLLRTPDHGVTWINNTGDLPLGVAARALAIDWRFDPLVMCVGSGSGVYCSFDAGATWIKDDLDLPNVNIGDLVLEPASGTLTAGTYGRGAWQAVLADCNNNGLVDGREIADGTAQDTNGDGRPDDCEAPLPAPYPHNRAKNRYLSFDTNRAEYAGVPIALQVELLDLELASCSGNGGRCRLDHGDDDCKACSVSGAPCLNAGMDCPAGETCDPTGDICVNDLHGSVGQTWWVGAPDAGGVARLVSLPLRHVSANWPAVVHVGDCEIVPQASYGVRVVAGEFTSAATVVETTGRPGTEYWADCVGNLADYCTGNWAPCPNGTADCAPGESCIQQWPPPDGAINFDDVGAAVFAFQAAPNFTVPEVTWIDLHGDDAGSAQVDPPNQATNFADIQFMVIAFQGGAYPFVDPALCPDVP